MPPKSKKTNMSINIPIDVRAKPYETLIMPLTCYLVQVIVSVGTLNWECGERI